MTVEAPLFAATGSDMGYFEDSVTVAGENGCGCAAGGCGCASGGCKCGDNCTCNPCNCK